MLCYVMLCNVMLCYVVLCYVMLCYVLLCYVSCYVSYHVLWIFLYFPVSDSVMLCLLLCYVMLWLLLCFLNIHKFSSIRQCYVLCYSCGQSDSILGGEWQQWQNDNLLLQPGCAPLTLIIRLGLGQHPNIHFIIELLSTIQLGLRNWVKLKSPK